MPLQTSPVFYPKPLINEYFFQLFKIVEREVTLMAFIDHDGAYFESTTTPCIITDKLEGFIYSHPEALSKILTIDPNAKFDILRAGYLVSYPLSEIIENGCKAKFHIDRKPSYLKELLIMSGWCYTPQVRIKTRFGSFYRLPSTIPYKIVKHVDNSKRDSMDYTTRQFTKILQLLSVPDDELVAPRNSLIRMFGAIHKFQTSNPVDFLKLSSVNQKIDKLIENPTRETLKSFENAMKKVRNNILQVGICSLCSYCLALEGEMQMNARKFIREIILIITQDETCADSISNNPERLVDANISYNYSQIWVYICNMLCMALQFHPQQYDNNIQQVIEMLNSLNKFLNTETMNSIN